MTRRLRTLAALALLAVATYPARLAIVLTRGVVLPGLQAEPGTTTHNVYIVSLLGIPLEERGIRVATVLLFLVAAVLIAFAFLLLFKRPKGTAP